jgi:hypothetical protein
VHTRPGFSISNQGDVNGDGADDVMIPSDDSENLQELYLGCKAGGSFTCEGPLSAEPVQALVASSARLHPDINGDGHLEASLFMDNGVTNFHLSEPGGAISPTVAWTMMEDAAFPGLGLPIEVGDMDGDGERHDFVVSALGRLYFYSPAKGMSAELKPTWSWPRSDSLPANYDVYRRPSVVVPGDLDGDGYDDLVVATAAAGDILDVPVGEVSIYGGGRVPKEPKDPPYIAPVRSCDLRLDPVNGKPDLTVDADAIARTLNVVKKTFADDACEVFEGCVAAPGERRLLRFSTAIQNLGRASAVFPPIDSRPDLYVFDECHGHDHLKGFAGYELRDSRGQQVLTGRKQGFALVDITSYCTDAAPTAFYDPMGISPGWADIYSFDIPCQWVDITGLGDGEYTLRVAVDTSDILEEESVHPNEVFVRMSLKGDTATVLP